MGVAETDDGKCRTGEVKAQPKIGTRLDHRVNGPDPAASHIRAVGFVPSERGYEMESQAAKTDDQADDPNSFEQRAARLALIARDREAELAQAYPEVIEAREREAEEEAREIGFSARLLVQATLPHSRPAPASRNLSAPTVSLRSTSRPLWNMGCRTAHILDYS